MAFAPQHTKAQDFSKVQYFECKNYWHIASHCKKETYDLLQEELLQEELPYHYRCRLRTQTKILQMSNLLIVLIRLSLLKLIQSWEIRIYHFCWRYKTACPLFPGISFAINYLLDFLLNGHIWWISLVYRFRGIQPNDWCFFLFLHIFL